MKKPSKTKLISTILALSSTAVLLGFAASSVAWLSMNRKVTANSATVKCYMDETVGILNNSFDIYGYDIENDEPDKMENLSLGDYDAFISKNNTYARRFIRAQLFYPNIVNPGEELEIKIQCSPNHLFVTKDTGTFIDKYISNLIQFKFLDNFDNSIPKVADDESNITEIYNKCFEKFESISENYTFVNKLKEPVSESDKITLITARVPLPESAVGVSGYQTDFFIEYNYNDTLVRFYRERAEDDYNLDVFEKTTKIDFAKDILSISFAVV